MVANGNQSPCLHILVVSLYIFLDRIFIQLQLMMGTWESVATFFFLFVSFEVEGIKTGFLYVTALTVLEPTLQTTWLELTEISLTLPQSTESKGATPPCGSFIPFDLVFSSALPTANEYKIYHTSDVLSFLLL